ncbi:MAG: DUF192 domain-containing protein [Flavobacteriales bacterium]|jgi:uncharacterized membrane protein (UPF0127 family)|nr:DUF192 domain-containing protein [Flavobacteriales bacterium]
MKFLFPALILLLFTVSCKNEKEQTPVTLAEISFIKQAELQLIKSSNDSILKTLDIEIADDEYKTQTGLMYRQSMEENQGMLFIFPDAQVRSFYMKNTEIPLDIIYIDKNKKIVSFQKNARPYDATSLPSGVPAQYVLEINAGLSDRWNLQVGDRIDWENL